MAILGYALSVAGWEYLVATQGVTTLPTGPASSEWDSGWYLVSGALKRPESTWTERARPIDADLDYSGQTFTIYDVTPTTGDAAGHLLMTWACTRDEDQVVNTIISTAGSGITTAASLANIVVASDTGFAAGGGYLYIDQETIKTNAHTAASNTFTPSARGVYGSRAVPHLTDAANSYGPAVFAQFPGFDKRRVVLWEVDDTNAAKPIWTGYASRPRLDSEGVSYDIECTSSWIYQKQSPLGIPPAVPQIYGWDYGAVHLIIQPEPGLSHHIPYDSSSAIAQAQLSRYPTDSFAGLISLCGSQLQTYITTYGTSPTYYGVAASVDGDTVTFTATFDDGDPAKLTNFNLSIRVADRSASDSSYNDTSNAPSVGTVQLGFVPDALITVAPVSHGQSMQSTYLVTSIANFPSTWALTQVGDVYHTTIQYLLVGEADSDRTLHIEPSSVTSTYPFTITGVASLWKRSSGGPTTAINGGVITNRVTMRLATRTTTDNWLYGLAYGVLATSNAITQVDVRDWDFSELGVVARAIEGTVTARVYTFDGSERLGDIVRDAAAASGCGIGVRAGKLQLFAFQPPLPSSTLAATFTSPYVEKPKWSRAPDGICNVLTVDSPLLKFKLADQRSIARYGAQRTASVKLSGIEDAEVASTLTPQDFIDYYLRRIVGIWSRPVSSVKLAVGMSYLHTVFIGDYVSVTDWLAPAGDGTIGNVAAIGQVVGREVNLGAATIVFEVLLYGVKYVAGYSMCLRVAGVSGANVTIDQSTYLGLGYSTPTNNDPVSTASDYAGSNLPGYAFTSLDGGFGLVAAGMRLRLVLRDSTTLTTQDFVVNNTSGGGVIVATGAITGAATWQGYITGGGIVDCIFSAYDTSGLTAVEKQYAWVGAEAAPNHIGASSDHETNWSP